MATLKELAELVHGTIVGDPDLLIKGTSDSHNATLSIYGSGGGIGRVYVGQGSELGGGIEYNGDDSPGTTGAGADYITLWRKSNADEQWTARNKYDSNLNHHIQNSKKSCDIIY